jgi:MFS family permease
MIVGMILLGFACSLIFVPLLPEIISAVQDKEKIGENNELNDKASSVFNVSYATGCLIAPILGGALNDHFQYRTTCDIMALSAAGFSLIYFFFNVLSSLIANRKTKEIKKKYEKIG